jgi:hypothetical protein
VGERKNWFRRIFRRKREGGENYIKRNIICTLHGIKTIKSRTRKAGHVARMGKMKNVHTASVRKQDGKSPLGITCIDEKKVKVKFSLCFLTKHHAMKA